jgi:hypothetical protein
MTAILAVIWLCQHFETIAPPGNLNREFETDAPSVSHPLREGIEPGIAVGTPRIPRVVKHGDGG